MADEEPPSLRTAVVKKLEDLVRCEVIERRDNSARKDLLAMYEARLTRLEDKVSELYAEGSHHLHTLETRMMANINEISLQVTLSRQELASIKETQDKQAPSIDMIKTIVGFLALLALLASIYPFFEWVLRIIK